MPSCITMHSIEFPYPIADNTHLLLRLRIFFSRLFFSILFFFYSNDNSYRIEIMLLVLHHKWEKYDSETIFRLTNPIKSRVRTFPRRINFP